MLGGTEETTTGLLRLRALEAEGRLGCPVLAVNEAGTERLFNDHYGTGQSTLDGILRATNLLVAGKTFVVLGYGWTGKGVALRARGAGAQVIICEVDPMRALEARMEGFEVMPALRGRRARRRVRDRHGLAAACSASRALRADEGRRRARQRGATSTSRSTSRRCGRRPTAASREVLPMVEQYAVGGRKLNLLASGRVVNLAAGQGHPAAVMDMSFANQALAVEHLVRHPGRARRRACIRCPRRSTARSPGSSSSRSASRSTSSPPSSATTCAPGPRSFAREPGKRFLSAEEIRAMRFVRAESREDVLAEVAEELRLSGVTNDIADQVVADFLGLNRTDTRCLDIIERLDGVSAGRLASEAGLSTGAVTTVLDRLERAGYARRVQDPGDRRRVLVELTPPARRGWRSSTRRSPTPTMRQLEVHDRRSVSLVRDFMRDNRRLNEAHAERVRARRRVRSGGRGGLVALGPLVLAIGLREHAHEQVDERDAHHERLLERHDQAGDVEVVEPAQPEVRAGRAVAVVDQLGREGQQDPEQADEQLGRAPCRGPGPCRRAAGGERIGDSRCHQ